MNLQVRSHQPGRDQTLVWRRFSQYSQQEHSVAGATGHVAVEALPDHPGEDTAGTLPSNTQSKRMTLTDRTPRFNRYFWLIECTLISTPATKTISRRENYRHIDSQFDLIKNSTCLPVCIASVALPNTAVSLSQVDRRYAVGDGRLRPRCRHLVDWTKCARRLWFWSIRSIMWKHDAIHKTGTTWRIKLASGMTEPRPQGTCTMKFGRLDVQFLANVILTFTFAICYRPSVCRLSVVCLCVVCLWRWCALLSRLIFSAIFFTIW